MNRKVAMNSEKMVGQTAGVGFQIGVRRTLPITREQAWAYLVSSEGLSLWLGEGNTLEQLEVGETFESREGISGQVRVLKPFHQIRMAWRAKAWEHSSTLQIRLLQVKSDRTTISFHQEKLADAHTREQMKLHWEQVLATMTARTNSQTHEDK
ncbi:SRPBCC domain-containing protein [Paenibacillus guangzhouensis]|uniref:SRPBCC domain-containing protein n=1 Tax=Paenibacillus guangzhouensis TaxID=1473112 RepID=UPI00126718EA|nr:SRPBCC domain-containing protein [Paenibacillus guangzhouensis]